MAPGALNGKMVFDGKMQMCTVKNDVNVRFWWTPHNKRIITRSFSMNGLGPRGHMRSICSKRVGIPKIHQFRSHKCKIPIANSWSFEVRGASRTRGSIRLVVALCPDATRASHLWPEGEIKWKSWNGKIKFPALSGRLQGVKKAPQKIRLTMPYGPWGAPDELLLKAELRLSSQISWTRSMVCSPGWWNASRKRDVFNACFLFQD